MKISTRLIQQLIKEAHEEMGDAAKRPVDFNDLVPFVANTLASSLDIDMISTEVSETYLDSVGVDNVVLPQRHRLEDVSVKVTQEVLRSPELREAIEDVVANVYRQLMRELS